MGPSLARRIERALMMLEHGSTLTEALRAGMTVGHPEVGLRPADWKARGQLEDALRAAQRLRAGPHPTPRPEFRAAARERIVAAARAGRATPPADRRLWRRFLPAAAALSLVSAGVIVSLVRSEERRVG